MPKVRLAQVKATRRGRISKMFDEAPPDVRVESAAKLVRVIVSDLAAAAFVQLLALAVNEPMEIADFGRKAGIEGDAKSILERLRIADASFANAFGCRMFDDIIGIKGPRGGDPADPTHVIASKGFNAMIAWQDYRPYAQDVPSPNGETRRWIDIACTAAKAGRGHHVVLRIRAEDVRSASDYAAMCAATGARTAYVSARRTMEAAVLGAELYGPGIVVVVDGSRLLASGGDGEATDEEAANAPAATLEAAAFASSALAWLGSLKNLYVWRIPAVGELPGFLDGVVGGCIDGVGYDGAWRTGVLQALAPGLGPAGLRALHALRRDPRDAPPVVGLALAAGTAAGTTVDDACARLAKSLGAREPDIANLTGFDRRLLPPGDCTALFERAAALTEGGRILFHGAPGGGKTALARAIALRIDPERPVLPIAPARFLARGWGATERRLTAFFADAAAKDAIVLADELGSLCPVRDPDPQRHGNAMLSQSLTDEWLRLLDAHPGLVVIATVNDLGSVDPAVRRRFQACVYVPPDLDPRRELIAWEAILATKPPPGWLPCGAAVSDFTAAAERCRLLGRRDPASLANAVRNARDLRKVGSNSRQIRSTAH